ncbi:hypothetical protein [Kaistia granuli]|uniref:hypothetical protein n=1 Tax=Kaistia granuli TaxID=363259 RepID=UPI0003753EC5|nr:hypothetical protein [Kaistia granuli]
MRFPNPFAPREPSQNAEAAARIKAWTRTALGLDEATRVLVHEIACARPGCAPRETVVLVVPAEAPPFRIALHKSMRDLTEAELARVWRARSSAIDGEGPPGDGRPASSD